MAEWTNEAREYFAAALQRLREDEEARGGSGEEFAQDIRLHIETELSESAAPLVTEELLKKRFVSILGYDPLKQRGEAGKESKPIDDASLEEMRNLKESKVTFLSGGGFRFWIWAFGVALPAFTLGFELVTRSSASGYIDPIPSWGHALLVAIVPVVCGWLVSFTKKRKAIGKWNFRALGIALAISTYFTIPYAVMVPFAVIGILFFGLGLLPLAPLMSLLAQLSLVRRLRKLYPDFKTPWKQVGLGVLLGVVLIGLVDSQRLATKYALSLTIGGTKEEVSKGVALLRAIGSEKQMLEACLPNFANHSRYLGWWEGSRISPERAREIFYRVTGREFYEVADERAASLSGRDAMGMRNRWDWYRGDQVVGRKIEGLSLEHSRIDAEIDADAGHGYAEWTMEFENAYVFQAEARALLELPPGGAVSRVNLWINDEPREAAFSAKRKVVEAYQRVVNRRRDPVLVTTKGKDHVIVQCFPVPQNGKMKIRVGVVFPLQFEGDSKATFTLPRIAGRNFEVSDNLNTPLWIDAKSAMQSDSLGWRDPSKTIRTDIDFKSIETDRQMVRVDRDPDFREFWSINPYSGGITQGRIVEQENEEAAKQWIVVLDSSNSISPHRSDLLGALAAQSERISKIVVPDESHGFRVFGNLDELEWKIRGGQDNGPALTEALRLCEGRNDVSIIWIHGEQRRKLSSTEGIHRQINRRPNKARIYTLAYEPGLNVFLGALEMDLETQSLPRYFKNPADDLSSFLDSSTSSAKRWTVRYEPLEQIALGQGAQVSDHATRLWALSEAKRIFYAGKKDSYDRAADLAARHQLVTVVSGAVVLENQAQYDEAGLSAVEKGTTSSIPDGGATALLLALGLGALSGMRLWRRRGVAG